MIAAFPNQPVARFARALLLTLAVLTVMNQSPAARPKVPTPPANVPAPAKAAPAPPTEEKQPADANMQDTAK